MDLISLASNYGLAGFTILILYYIVKRYMDRIQDRLDRINEELGYLKAKIEDLEKMLK